MDRETKKVLDRIAKSLDGIDKNLKKIASDNTARPAEQSNDEDKHFREG
ncbi:hypothetical protein [Mycobacteroides abscessus]